MKLNHTINEILKSSVRLVSKKKFESEADFKEQVDNFIGSIQSNVVKLSLKSLAYKKDKTEQPYQHWKIVFEPILVLEDPYVDTDVYKSGSVFIFLSEKFYGDVNKNSVKMMGSYPEWNVSKNIATITGNARDY